MIGLVLFAWVGAKKPYWQLLAALFMFGLGVGAAMIPIMVAELQSCGTSRSRAG
ncbi:hypothetical protein [Saccharothrix sp.]|uniref:hypothetical protein n=1 Tax=Saccharothrix sp. TaxID=1873460 RepID=UPI0028113A70|nr:hypothetical protein [Saccharothrix sp.]